MALPEVLSTLYQLEEQTRAALVQQTASKGAAAIFRWLSGRGRAEREQLQRDFHRVALRCRYRLQVLVKVLSAQRDLSGAVGMVSRYTMTIEMLERLTEDLAGLIYYWRRISDHPKQDVTDAAEEIVLALAAQMGERDPGWLRPQARNQHRGRVRELELRVDAALSAFELATSGGRRHRWLQRNMTAQGS